MGLESRQTCTRHEEKRREREKQEKKKKMKLETKTEKKRLYETLAPSRGAWLSRQASFWSRSFERAVFQESKVKQKRRATGAGGQSEARIGTLSRLIGESSRGGLDLETRKESAACLAFWKRFWVLVSGRCSSMG